MKTRNSRKGTEEKGRSPEKWTQNLIFPGIVLNAFATVVRNVAGATFSAKSTPEGRSMLRDELFRSISESNETIWKLTNLDLCKEDEVRRLEELLLIPQSLAERGGGAGLMQYMPPASEEKGGRSTKRKTKPLQEDAAGSVWVNGDEHLCFRSVSPSGDMNAVFNRVYEMEEALDGTEVEYAFDPTFGYLTSDPADLGTGLHVGMTLQLTGLYLSGDLPKVLHALERLGMDVRGIFDDNREEAPGALYRISNGETLGESETEILIRTSDILQSVAVQEEWARIRMMESRLDEVLNYVIRSLALGRCLRLVAADEAVNLFYAAKFGLEVSLLGELTPEAADRTNPQAFLNQSPYGKEGWRMRTEQPEREKSLSMAEQVNEWFAMIDTI